MQLCLIQQRVDSSLQFGGRGLQLSPATARGGRHGLSDAQLDRHQAGPAATGAQGSVAVDNGHRQQRGPTAGREQGGAWQRLVDPSIRCRTNL